MEITINRNTVYGILAVVTVLAVLSLGALGKPVTPPASAAGETRLLTWNDWQLFKAERRYEAEQEILRLDADALATLLNKAPDPVAAQMFAQRIARHTSAGEAALLAARSALEAAAQDVASWSTGALDRDTAVVSLQTVSDLLK